MSRELHRVRAQGSGKSLVTLWSRQPQSQIKLNSKEKDQQPYRLFTEREIQMVPNHVKNAHLALLGFSDPIPMCAFRWGHTSRVSEKSAQCWRYLPRVSTRFHRLRAESHRLPSSPQHQTPTTSLSLLPVLLKHWLQSRGSNDLPLRFH